MKKDRKDKNNGAKNPLYTIENLTELITTYTNKKIKGKEYPILYECLIEKGLNPKYVNEINRNAKAKNDYTLDDAISMLLLWQEVILEKMLITGNGSPAGIIFKLKQPQHGWTDRQQVEHSATDDIIKMIEAKNKMIKEAIDNSDL